ncbi:MAG: hypothetical protein L3J70_11265 [Gammaproteobacteria bacterium]|nr:hypothetical protein [Gammaproteobacteria bacterium]
MNTKLFIKILLCIILSTVTGCASHNITLNPTSEAKSKPHLVAKLFADDHKKCSRFYYSNTTWVVEVHCDVNSIKSGIYIIDPTGTSFYDWFDSAFNSWAWAEGCNDETSCFYEAVVDSKGKVTELTYIFYINLSEGYYKMTVKGNSLKVTKKKITDLPS